jgi:hypothetical protein
MDSNVVLKLGSTAAPLALRERAWNHSCCDGSCAASSVTTLTSIRIADISTYIVRPTQIPKGGYYAPKA